MKLGDQVKVTLYGTINSVGSSKSEPGEVTVATVFVDRPGGVTDFHGWGSGQIIAVTPDQVEVLGPREAAALE